MANPLDARFCGGCGAQLSETCAECGRANDPGMRFCNYCGAPLDPEQAAQPVAAPSADRVGVEPAVARERRFVTVLFVDLVGFTTLSESRDSEEVRDLLSQYFEMCRQVIGRYGGSVEKFIGDAVRLSGGSRTLEDDAERAVRAALEVVQGVSDLGVELTTDLSARAGC